MTDQTIDQYAGRELDPDTASAADATKHGKQDEVVMSAATTPRGILVRELASRVHRDARDIESVGPTATALRAAIGVLDGKTDGKSAR